ncbi:CRISPR-associated endonuclease Cas3'' [Paenibacillus chitinolyticus]|uniref:CRISPR-associated endonuclease Cas3'' n=1 Tax=Paenibacillus chitinolyticus TaxID=79263 RepID=UPI0036715C01
MYYAHRTNSDDVQSWQPLEEHLREVAWLAGEFAEQFGAKQWGELVGWLHDAGKYSAEFQSRLRGTPIPVDHSTAGAKLIMERVSDERLGLITAYVIAGHHTGLPDCGNLNGEESCLRQRLNKKVCSHEAFHEEITRLNVPDRAPSIQPGVDPSFQFSFFIRR